MWFHLTDFPSSAPSTKYKPQVCKCPTHLRIHLCHLMSREVCYHAGNLCFSSRSSKHLFTQLFEKDSGTKHISDKPLTAQVLGLTVLQISLRRRGLGQSHPTQTVWSAGHWPFPSPILGGNRSFLWGLIAVPALLIEQFIVGYTRILQFLPTAEKLQESPLGKCVLQDLAYLSLLMLLTILPSTHVITNLFLSLNQPFIFHLFCLNEPQAEREFSVHSRTIEEQTASCGWGWDPWKCLFLIFSSSWKL